MLKRINNQPVIDLHQIAAIANDSFINLQSKLYTLRHRYRVGYIFPRNYTISNGSTIYGDLVIEEIFLILIEDYSTEVKHKLVTYWNNECKLEE